jgi:hypothetical protein
VFIHNVVTCKRNNIYNNLHGKIYIMVICVTSHASAAVMEWPIHAVSTYNILIRCEIYNDETRSIILKTI